MNDEYKAALAQLRQAEQNFLYADPQYVDKAAIELHFAQLRVDAILKILKVGVENEPDRKS